MMSCGGGGGGGGWRHGKVDLLAWLVAVVGRPRVCEPRRAIRAVITVADASRRASYVRPG